MPGKTRRKRLLLWKDHPYCHWCKRPLRFASATIEHLTPRSKGGSYELDNLTIACYACNSRRGNNEDWQADDRHRVGYTCKMCDRTEFFTGQSLRKVRQKLRHAGWCQFFRGLVCPECALKHKVREFRPAGTE